MKNIVKSIAMMCILFMFTAGCTKTINRVETRLETTPDSLLVDPCNVIGAGDTVRTLAKGYVVSVSCVREYQLLLEKQRRHKREASKIYEQ